MHVHTHTQHYPFFHVIKWNIWDFHEYYTMLVSVIKVIHTRGGVVLGRRKLVMVKLRNYANLTWIYVMATIFQTCSTKMRLPSSSSTAITIFVCKFFHLIAKHNDGNSSSKKLPFAYVERERESEEIKLRWQNLIESNESTQKYNSATCFPSLFWYCQ